jgi:succinate dehydrogenase/fumarate reductase-like Fe-S protein
MIEFEINGRSVSVDADPDTPLLWAIRDEVGLTGTKFGCGIGMCGACTVHVGGRATRSCITPLSRGMAQFASASMWILPIGSDHAGRGPAARHPPAYRR